MTVVEARSALEDHFVRWSGAGVETEERAAIDALIVAVRAEMTAPVEQTEASADAERWLSAGVPCPDRHRACTGCRRRANLLVTLLGRLRDRIAQVEAEKMSLDAQLGETERQLEGMRHEYRKLQAENAELRKLCGMAGKRIMAASRLLVTHGVVEVDEDDVQEEREFAGERSRSEGREVKKSELISICNEYKRRQLAQIKTTHLDAEFATWRKSEHLPFQRAREAARLDIEDSMKAKPRRRAKPFRRWSVRFGAISYNDGRPQLVLPELVEVAKALNRARVVLPKVKR